MCGDLGDIDVTKIPGTQTKVVIFISSTFTDTTAERNTLIRGMLTFFLICQKLLSLSIFKEMSFLHSIMHVVNFSGNVVTCDWYKDNAIADVYPYLRTVSRILGLDFESVDMRWGIKEETSYEHGTLDMCLREVDRYSDTGCSILSVLGLTQG